MDDKSAQGLSNTAAPVNTSRGIAPNTEKTIANILLAEKLITDVQYNQLKTEAINRSVSIDKVVLDSKVVSDEIYYEARAKLIGAPFVSVVTLPFSPEALSFVPKTVAERFNIIPFAYDKESNSLSVAMSNPLDVETINFLRQKTGATIASFQAIPAEISSAIQNQYTFGLIGEVKAAIKET